MVTMQCSKLAGAFICMCVNMKEYFEEIKKHTNVVVYYPEELKQFEGLNDYGVRELHRVKEVFFDIGEPPIGLISPETSEPVKKKLSISEMRNKLKANGIGKNNSQSDSKVSEQPTSV